MLNFQDFNPLDLFGFIAVFSFSFAASIHCAFMCSPLVCAAMGDRAKINQPGIWLYNLGRGFSYISAGIALGAGSQFIDQWLPWISPYIFKVLGTLILIIALLKLNFLITGRHLEIPIKISPVLFQKSQSLVRRTPTRIRDFLLGCCTVLLPCMTLSPALLAAAASGSAAFGGMLMFAFYLGTLPTMLAATYVPLIVYRKLPEKTSQWIAVIFLFILSITALMKTAASCH